MSACWCGDHDGLGTVHRVLGGRCHQDVRVLAPHGVSTIPSDVTHRYEIHFG
jgi:hypothetical protein